MNIIEQIIYYMHMVGICTIVAVLLALGVIWYFLKVKKIAAKEENIDRSHFKREDSISYVPFKDILYKGDLDEEGIIALTDTLFVGGISVKGFDYGSASAAERVDAQVNSVSFFNVIEEPVTFRGTVKANDLSINIEEYEEVVKRLAVELMELDADYQTTLSMGEDYIDDPETYQYYADRLKELQREISAKNHMLDECNAVIHYMKSLSGDAPGGLASKQNANQIMFAYKHDPDKFSSELTKEEIYLKAQDALNAKARAYMDALAFCHFRGKRLSCRELITLIRKHGFPLTGEDGRIEELLDSSYTSLFVSSDSLMEAQRERVGEEVYAEMVADYERQLEEVLRQQRVQLEREADFLKEQTYLQALDELGGGEVL